ncbi:homoserine kinase [Helicobacter himalayensis]|uniref:homoserine kinase n=1 Tax=Helicobacter himalayensis TaxID=1591088 RepID=UPI00082F6995|nr:homoserine kinase [Helicobacter himalayensis]
MKIIVPATSANLGPGFDSLGLALSLYNTIAITPASITSIQIIGEGKDNVRLKTDNIFVKIFSEILQSFDKKVECKFLFENNIPVSRGLGSSSAVIVSAIYAAYAYAKKPLDKDAMLNIAIKYENHPDNITPALFGGFNVAALQYSHKSTKNEITQNVLRITAPIPKDISAVVVVPNKSISTKLSRKALPKTYNLKDCVFNLSHSSLLTAAFLSHDWEKLRLASRDKLHQNVRMKNLPILFGLQKLSLNNGALSSTLSGSGSSFLNICYKEDSAHLCKVLQEAFPKFRVLELEFDNLGVRECKC